MHLMMQAFVYHDVIGKRIVALQQLRTGLNILGLLDTMTKNAKLFVPLLHIVKMNLVQRCCWKN